jgi:hypothetical protein
MINEKSFGNQVVLRRGDENISMTLCLGVEMMEEEKWEKVSHYLLS